MHVATAAHVCRSLLWMILHYQHITCPANLTIECDESTLPATTGTATATDNCDATPLVTFTDVTVASGLCVQEYTISRTWISTDACGNVSPACVQIITVDDSTAPVLTCPEDMTVECTDSTLPLATGLATATDNCDLVPIVSFSDATVASGVCEQEYTILRTWTATDDCGNTSTCLQTVTVDDSTPPVIICPADPFVECSAGVEPVLTGTATATDNCDPEPVLTFTDVTVGSFICTQEYLILRTWVATDACGNTSSCMQSVVVDDSTPPVIICPPGVVTLECTDSTLPNSTLPGMATATDNCDDSPEVTFTDVTVASPICPQEYTITRTWIATDECGNVSPACVQVITIDDSTAPVITCPADVTLECTDITLPGSTAPGMATATDNCDAIPTVTFVDVTIASGICDQEYTILRTWSAADDCGNINACIQTITIDDSTPPLVTCPADITIECSDSTLPADVGMATATDNCTEDVLLGFADVINPGLGNFAITDFTGSFDFSNWTAITPNQGAVTTSGNSQVTLTSPDGAMAPCTFAATQYQIVIPVSGQLNFDWNWTGPAFTFFQPFG